MKMFGKMVRTPVADTIKEVPSDVFRCFPDVNDQIKEEEGKQDQDIVLVGLEVVHRVNAMQESWVRQCPVVDYQDCKVQYDQQDADHQEHIEGPMMPVTLPNRVDQVDDSIDGAWKEKSAKED